MGRCSLTFEERRGEIDAQISIPGPFSLALHVAWDTLSVKLLQALKDAVTRTKADDDLGHAEKEGLNPEFEKFPLKLDHITIILNRLGRLQLHPIDWVLLVFRLAVPDYQATGQVRSKLDLKSSYRHPLPRR